MVYTGMSIMDYIRIRKMQYAQTELTKGKKVIDIALQLGYSSDRSFRRVFKMVYHQPPSKIRKDDYTLPEKIIKIMINYQ